MYTQKINYSIIFFLLMLLGNSNIFAQHYLKLTKLDSSCDSLILETSVWFAFGWRSTCPNLNSYQSKQCGDTIELSLFYDISGYWPQVGCESIDTILMKTLPNVTFLKGITYSIDHQKTIIKQSTHIIEICSPNKINNTGRETSFVIYPNPTAGFLILLIESFKTESAILYNVCGQKLKCWSGLCSTNELDISELPAGIYFIVVSGMPKVVKIIKI
jgi:hypothetical protein